MAYIRNTTTDEYFPRNVVGTSPTRRFSSQRTVTLTQSRTGTKMPDYKVKIKAGLNATTPYQLNSYKLVSRKDGVATFKGSPIPVPDVPTTGVSYFEMSKGFENVPPASFGHLVTTVGTADSIAKSKIYSKIRSEQERLNSPAILAELHSTMSQFGKPLQAIVDLTNRRLNRLELESRGLRGSVAFRKVKFAEIVASTWLEYSFGLKPLISDTEAIAEALARWNHEKSETITPRSKVQSRAETKVVQKTKSATGLATQCTWIHGYRTMEWESVGRVQYCVGLNTSVIADFGSNERLLQLLGFNPSNWIPAVWEVIPWTWLVDYFTNIQQIMEASATNVASVSWISKTVTYRTSLKSTYYVDGPASTKAARSNRTNGGAAGTLGSFEIVRTTMDRSIPLSLGVPSLYFELPSKATQFANMIAVLMSRRPSSSALWLT